MIHDCVKQADVTHLAVNEVSFFGHDFNEATSVGTFGTNQPELLVSVNGCFHESSFRWLVKSKHDFSAFKVSRGDTAACDSCFGQSPLRKVSGPLATNIIAPFDRPGQILPVAMNAMRDARFNHKPRLNQKDGRILQTVEDSGGAIQHEIVLTDSLQLYKLRHFGLPKRPLISTRRPWFKMEQREVPPILFAYLGRRNTRFILNEAGILPDGISLRVSLFRKCS
jgi:hypothetical protein